MGYSDDAIQLLQLFCEEVDRVKGMIASVSTEIERVQTTAAAAGEGERELLAPPLAEAIRTLDGAQPHLAKAISDASHRIGMLGGTGGL